MLTDTKPALFANGLSWAGAVLTGAAVLFLVFDGVTKVMQLTPVVEASAQVGVPPESLPGVGIVLLACTAIYSIPRTALLGAILLTGYLGGAVAIHVCAGSGLFPIAFSIAFGVVVWGGLVLREPRLLGIILRLRGSAIPQ